MNCIKGLLLTRAMYGDENGGGAAEKLAVKGGSNRADTTRADTRAAGTVGTPLVEEEVDGGMRHVHAVLLMLACAAEAPLSMAAAAAAVGGPSTATPQTCTCVAGAGQPTAARMAAHVRAKPVQ